jgi:hypothetical protein
MINDQSTKALIAQLAALEQKCNRLEQRNNRFRQILVGSIFVMALMQVAGAATQQVSGEKVITANRVVIEDEKGNQVMSLGKGADGASFEIWDKNRRRIFLGINAAGDAVHSLANVSGADGIILATKKENGFFRHICGRLSQRLRIHYF